MQGENKYKTTRLIWNQFQFNNFQFTPMVRGFLTKPLGFDNDNTKNNYIGKYDNLQKVTRGKMTVENNKISNYKLFIIKVETILNKYRNLSDKNISNPTDKKEIELYLNKAKNILEDFKTMNPDELQENFPKYKKNIISTLGLVGRRLILYKESIKGSSDIMNVYKESRDAKLFNSKQSCIDLTKSIINNKNKITQSTLNSFSNILNQDPSLWRNSKFNKLNLVLDNNDNHLFEFVIPKLDKVFIKKFLDGNNTLNELLTESAEIKMFISSNIINHINDEEDIYNLFENAINFYQNDVTKLSNIIMENAIKYNHKIKHILSNTKLDGLIIYPISSIFVFDNINEISEFEDNEYNMKQFTEVTNLFIDNYNSSKDNKNKSIDKLKYHINILKESTNSNANIKHLYYLTEEVEKFYNHEYDSLIIEANNIFNNSAIDHNTDNKKLVYMREAFGVKKLKKFPADLVAYITIETEAIRDSSSKYAIASYTLGKLELIDWYRELLSCGSKKYLVPHTKPYLDTLRTQLLVCYKKIMNVKITNPNDRPLIDIKYPSGYEG